MKVKIIPKCQRAKNRVREHGEIMNLITLEDICCRNDGLLRFRLEVSHVWKSTQFQTPALMGEEIHAVITTIFFLNAVQHDPEIVSFDDDSEPIPISITISNRYGFPLFSHTRSRIIGRSIHRYVCRNLEVTYEYCTEGE